MSMADRDGQIWYDGKLVPWRDATTHVLTHSLHYGLAVFEGTVVAVTHDRWFTRSFVRFVLFGGDGEVTEVPEPVWDVR